MATKDEQRSAQAYHYYELLCLREKNRGTHMEGLDDSIFRAKAVMLEPEIAWVEKQIAEFFKNHNAK